MFVLILVFGAGAAFEESLFRGYMLQTFVRAGLGWLAIGSTSVFFALVHLGNEGANALSTMNTALAGVWFGAAYLKSRDIWFPFGLHLMWNWIQGSVFGIEVSGIKHLVKAPLMLEVDNGPNWVTGGEYGIEGGIVTTVAILLSIAAIYILPFPKPNPRLLEMTSNENPVRATTPVS
jgi:hypothetical protein